MLLKAIHERLYKALEAASEEGLLNLDDIQPEIKVEIPRDTQHGDYATNLAMTLAKPARMAPRKIAETLISKLQDPMFEAIEIAGPGFINFRLSWTYLLQGLTTVLSENETYGQQEKADAHRYLLEFVSANPTGPMHFGHGRWAVLGDCLARLMREAGFDVTTEFYINDVGAQVNNLGASVQACYFKLLLDAGLDLSPEARQNVADYQSEKNATEKIKVRFYHGAYIMELAQEMQKRYGNEADDQPLVFFSDFAKASILEGQRREMDDFDVHFSEWFPESRLHAEGAIQEALDHLKSQGVTYEEDGALWFRSSDYGDDKDRVLIKNTGATTYFANDIAYHWNKLKRGYDRLINIWGADHHGYIERVQASIQALDYPKETLEILLGQIVHLYREGEPVRMSKRTGDMITFGEVFEEVGRDATRYLLMQRSADASIDFDLQLAKEQSSENPVFYIQYAHARISSIFRTAQQSDALSAMANQLEGADLSLLTMPQERTLLLKTLTYPDELVIAAMYREPHRLAAYAQELAANFHSFYKQCRVLDEDNLALSQARLYLAQATRIVIRNVLTRIFGITAPESM